MENYINLNSEEKTYLLYFILNKWTSLNFGFLITF